MSVVLLQCAWKTGSQTTLNQCCEVHITKSLIVSKVTVEKLKEMSWTSNQLSWSKILVPKITSQKRANVIQKKKETHLLPKWRESQSVQQH